MLSQNFTANFLVQSVVFEKVVVSHTVQAKGAQSLLGSHWFHAHTRRLIRVDHHQLTLSTHNLC